MWRQFKGALADRRGATAVAFALIFADMAPMSLGIFDVYTATEQRGKLQDALDAATLYAARSTAQTDSDIATQGSKALSANLQLITGATLQSSSFHIVGPKVVAQASVALPALAPQFFQHEPVTVSSEVQRGMDKLEVALVLDNTGSMQGAKLTTLKSQAKILIDKLVAGSQNSSDSTPLRISLVPFSSTVRVQGTTSLSSYSAASHSGPGIPSWLDPQAKSHWTSGRQDVFSVQYTDRFAVMKTIGQSWAGCVEQRMAPNDVTETPPTTSDPDTMFTSWFWADEPDTNKFTSVNDYLPDVSASTTFMTREKYAAKYVSGATWRHTGTIAKLGTGFTYGPNAGCSLQPMMRLTTDFTSVKTAIDAMTAIGDTNIPLGLAWGWHTLSPNAPLADGLPYSTLHLKKIVILMTDGTNTFTDSGDSNSSFYSGQGWIWELLTSLVPSSNDTQRQAAMDARLAQLCTNMKAQKIDISTAVARYRHVVQSCFNGRRIVVFSGGEAKGTDAILAERGAAEAAAAGAEEGGRGRGGARLARGGGIGGIIIGAPAAPGNGPGICACG